MFSIELRLLSMLFKIRCASVSSFRYEISDNIELWDTKNYLNNKKKLKKILKKLGYAKSESKRTIAICESRWARACIGAINSANLIWISGKSPIRYWRYFSTWLSRFCFICLWSSSSLFFFSIYTKKIWSKEFTEEAWNDWLNFNLFSGMKFCLNCCFVFEKSSPESENILVTWRVLNTARWRVCLLRPLVSAEQKRRLGVAQCSHGQTLLECVHVRLCEPIVRSLMIAHVFLRWLKLKRLLLCGAQVIAKRGRSDRILLYS